MKQFLSTFEIKDTTIDKKEIDTLHRFGLRTAADISEKRLESLAAIDRKSKEILSEWRKEIERSYEAKFDGELPKTVQKHLESKFGKKRRQVEKEIESVLANLRSGAMAFRQHQQKLMLKAESVAQNLLQAESNLSALGGQKTMIAILVGIAIIIPTVGLNFQKTSFKVQTAYKTPRPTNSPKFTISANQPDTVVKVNENITDREIARMTVYDREQSAKTLHTEAQQLIAAKDFKRAEKKLRLAVKFADYYVNILYTLSNLLYDQQNYSESIVFLKKSLVIDSENENAKLLIGANYLKMQKYDEAEKTFFVSPSQ
ncbi:MAG: hypothetical protein HC846_07905 [Blastocatellia bacterium]|nr:hypothetical protein [Blastocatellia bacterium]